MRSFASFLAMGGYAPFVWPAYGVALAVLGGLVLTSLRRYRSSRRALEALERGDGLPRRPREERRGR
jgi:heme exporter protein D